MLYAVLTGLSRMILGVHFPQDILGGLILGLAMLEVYGWVEPRIGSWLAKQTTTTKIYVVIAAAAIMLIIHPGLIDVSSPVWLTQPIPFANMLARPLIAIESFLGMGIGLVLEQRYLHFDSQGSLAQRIIRSVLGLVGMAVLYFVSLLLNVVSITLVTDLIRFGLMGLWAAYGAPWLFMKVGLSSPRQQVALHAPS